MKTALVTGATGQDGSYMMELLLEKGYKVYGAVRRSSSPNYWRIEHILNKIELVHCDVTDSININNLIRDLKPDECYNFASMSQVGISFKEPIHAAESVGMNCLYFLEAIRHNSPKTRYLYAGSSEQFGSEVEKDGFQNINTRMKVCSPYAASKLFAFNMVDIYRKSYGLNVRSNICFNHESPRRGEDFVTRKITRYLASLIKWLDDNTARPFELGQLPFYPDWNESPKLSLGNINSYRDWTHAKDCIEAFWLTMQADPKDYIISSMETHSVKEFLDLSFVEAQKYCNVNFLSQKDNLVSIDKNLYRPNEVDFLKGDSTPIRVELGWKPKYSFNELVSDMVKSDIDKCGSK
jgi:GDPmannose 4,6-dehydratase